MSCPDSFIVIIGQPWLFLGTEIDINWFISGHFPHVLMPVPEDWSQMKFRSEIYLYHHS